MVSVEATFSPTLAGENASATVGATGVTVMGAGHAVAAVPVDDGAFTVATPAAVNETLAVLSMWPAESVTASMRVPALPVDMTVTCGVFVAP
jgi:hypothetical protein